MKKQNSSFLERNRTLDSTTSVNGHRRIAEPPSSEVPACTKSALDLPIGVTLVLLVVMGITMFLSCYYHWEKIRNCISRITGSAVDSRPPIASVQNSLATRGQGPMTTPMPSKTSKFCQEDLSLSVVMPGDNVPKYIAWRSPHDPG